jgi:hypothetical protein
MAMDSKVRMKDPLNEINENMQIVLHLPSARPMPFDISPFPQHRIYVSHVTLWLVGY